MVVIAGAMARFSFPKNSKSSAQVAREPPRGRTGAAPQLDLEKLRLELHKARCRVGVLNEGEPPKLYPAQYTDDRRRSRSCSEAVHIAELPGSIPEDSPVNQESARPLPVAAPHSTDNVAIPKRRSSRPVSEKYGLPSGMVARKRTIRPDTIAEKALPATPEFDTSSMTESAELLALEKQFGLSAREKKPSKQDKLKRISKLQSMLGVPIPEIPSQDQPAPQPQRRAVQRKEQPRREQTQDSKQEGDLRKTSSDSPRDATTSSKKKKDRRHLDLQEVNRALRDASNINLLRDQIEELQKDLAQRNALISRYHTVDSLQSRFSTYNNSNSHSRERSATDSDNEVPPFGSEGSRNSLERSSGGESPSSESPATPPNETPHTAADRRFAQSELEQWWTNNSSHDDYTTFLGNATPALHGDETIPEDFPAQLMPKKYEPIELEAPVPVPSAVMKVVDINEHWADIECVESPSDSSDGDGLELDTAPLPPLKSARRVSTAAFAEFPAPQKALYEAIEEHLRRNSQEIPFPDEDYEVESPETFPESFVELSAESSPEQVDEEQQQEQEQEQEEEKALDETPQEGDDNKIDLASLPFHDSDDSPLSVKNMDGLGISF